ncbi:hypothetical protein [Yinghuangia sp. YIM S09857]|uniref:hypothetical protein n=1 Tax=Yinghuangia sp. YIM S09857 TaxID=3436929 RepID=UPI003F53D385
MSDLPLRRLLSRMALVAGVIAAAVCAWIAADADAHRGVWIFAAAVSAATALVAAIDLGVIRRRMHQRGLRSMRFPHPR